MNKKFTKVYEEEDARLRGCSYNVASVYFHLKNKRDYFKNKNQNNGTCYDLTKYISEYTGICEKTVKRAIKTLKEIGLISTVIKGKVNHYSFPVLDAIENGTEIPEKQNIENNINDIEDMGNFSGYAINNQRLEQVEETNYTPIGKYNDDEDLSKFPSEENFFTPVWNEEKQQYMGDKTEKPVETDFITDEEKYGSDIIDFIEENPEVLTSLRAVVDYFEYNDEDKELGAKGANNEINRLVKESGNANEDFVSRLEMYCADFCNDYKESINNRLNENEYDRYEFAS